MRLGVIHASSSPLCSLLIDQELYVTSTKKQKMRISRSIVEAVRSLEPAGRFLEKDQTTGKWFDIGDKKAVEKTSQALRDGAAGLRKQLSEDLSDPDFLSAVFDMDVIPEKKTVKKEKKALPKKGHRRTKSNPSVGSVRAKSIIKKQQRQGELAIPASPRSRGSITIQMIPKPPQSPMSPRSNPSSPRISISVGQGHRRAHSQGSVPLPPFIGSPKGYGSPYYQGPPPRSNSFEYQDYPDHRRPYPPPPGYGAHHPPSPSSHPGPAYGGPPRGFRPLSPRWSPRQFSHHPTPPHHSAPPHHHHPTPPHHPAPPPAHHHPAHHPGASLSPHPYMHTSDYHQRSPDVHHHQAKYSPREPYVRRGTPTYGGNLAVPTLGGERGVSPHRPSHPALPMSPMRYPPPSPRSQAHRPPSSGPLPIDFTPPPSARRTPSPFSMAGKVDTDKRESPRLETSTIKSGIRMNNTIPEPKKDSPEKIASSSPAGVVDVASNDEVVKEQLMLSPSRKQQPPAEEEDYPFDEGPNPAGEDKDIPMSPLPLDHREDPTTLMELPENILSLPISPCGPHDMAEI